MSKTPVTMPGIMQRDSDSRVHRIRTQIAPETAASTVPESVQPPPTPPPAVEQDLVQGAPARTPSQPQYAVNFGPPEREGTVPVSLRFPTGLHAELKRKSFMTGLSIQKMTMAALERYLTDNSEQVN